MSTATERGWGKPGTSAFEANLTTITVGPFPAKGKLTKPHKAVKFRVHKDVALMFACFLTQLIRDEGYRLDAKADDWGYCYRPVRGYEDEWKHSHDPRYLSNHSWGLAVDINSATNPLSTNGKTVTDMPKNIVAIARQWGLDWGGAYKGRRRDAMHFEWTASRDAAKTRTRELQTIFKKAA